jgi:lipoprotein NlpD
MRIFFICLCLVSLLYGCSSKPKQARHYHNSYHIVEKGDTLHSISWRYDVDANSVARWNNISRPYTIYPGQKLRVNSTAPIRGARASTKSSSSKSTAKASKKPAKPVKTVPVGDWRWPVKGRLLSRFSGSNNGIDIVAKEGAVVSATAAGKVVYAGSGLRGYGNLLIIKHNASYFSAYAHSRKLFVKEGATVKAGQKIAEVGSTGTDRAKLHFEIRKEGNPVDPLKYLPR